MKLVEEVPEFVDMLESLFASESEKECIEYPSNKLEIVTPARLAYSLLVVLMLVVCFLREAPLISSVNGLLIS